MTDTHNDHVCSKTAVIQVDGKGNSEPTELATMQVFNQVRLGLENKHKLSTASCWARQTEQREDRKRDGKDGH